MKYHDDLPSASTYAALFDTTGWNKAYRASADELYTTLERSWCIVSAYDATRLVGFGRVVSDDVLYAMIYDLIVVPSHQTKGIGSEILARLVRKCTTAEIRDIQLFSAAVRRVRDATAQEPLTGQPLPVAAD